MTPKLRDYILSEAETDWIFDHLDLTKKRQADALVVFVERMVLDAMIDNQIETMYLDEANDNPG